MTALPARASRALRAIRCAKAPGWAPRWLRRRFPGCWTAEQIAQARLRGAQRRQALLDSGALEPVPHPAADTTTGQD